MKRAWQTRAYYSSAGLLRPLADWVLEAGSLTKRLRACCEENFKVEVLRQMWGRSRPVEQAALGSRAGKRSLIREVVLYVDEKPAVFARTVIPYQTTQGRGRALLHLGTKPLGELLFNTPDVIRGPIEWTALHPHHILFQQAQPYVAEKVSSLYARRSVFYLAGQPLLVTEVLLFKALAPHRSTHL